MRGIRRASLLAVLPLLVAATCVTQTAQRGPEGPWVADVVNTGDQPVNGVSVAARVVDATGRELGVYSAFACPHVIEPGARGTAEIFAAWDTDTVLPLHADFIPAGSDGPVAFTSAAVTARVMEQHPERRFAIVEIRNDSTGAASFVDVCAVLRSADGRPLEVGSSRVFPAVLRPGQSTTVPIFFNAMPPGTIELFPWGAADVGTSSIELPASEFKVAHSRIARGRDSDALVVSGELRNPSLIDLAQAHLVAYASTSPETRVDVPIGCLGSVPFETTGAVSFAIPLARNSDGASLVIIGIEAGQASPSYAPPVVDVRFGRLPDQTDGLPTYAVHATVSNASGGWLHLSPSCATLRDAGGDVVGVAPLVPSSSSYSPIPPGQTFELEGVTFAVDEAAAVSAQVLGEIGLPPIAGPPSP